MKNAAQVFDNSTVSFINSSELSRRYKLGSKTLPENKKAMSITRIIRATAKYFKLLESDIRGHRRIKVHIDPRHTAAHISKRFGFSLSAIGRELNNRDHTTIINSVARAKALLETEDQFALDYWNIANTLCK